MTTYIREKRERFEIPDKLKNIYREMEISPAGLLKNYALNLVYGKIQKCEAENIFFEKKYGCTLREFKQKIKKMKNEENFEWEDDLMDWEFAVENVRYWQKKAQELK
ncbi:MAG: hypothetical protein COY75_03815 [Nitrospirae bacterium CG_4_10_14_0_8_um_filter_41_23]|nr:MAG: hypothetical protein COV68_05965 [Nitrospirae bacterium CG11_big_fil_rev_8_21_14_0_20_41_14]PIV42469.1 MAG: hypothetical protein COS27_07180 [Nitrospirae bacterium CG02_land_8_20_14_3_00_41_53]PIW87986.1 MAG: hypothetical protein COZ94_02195 [Nitrospirae bacterium CG_4_8_14_3_um_filter_41_47]PIY87244.1 MAG: hypothetical protein COY75_03815 [Nitrospirae bacterium CG_4_10_14_0_8_um_filter_41_23]PJA79312.1 MAG: hypothetical protein CO148_08145 [Nitrospirae bacterium CG_4_9_14_3_um_filter_4